MREFFDTFLRILAVIFDSSAAWFFCCVISIFILPLILDRIIFYIPKLISLSGKGEVYYRSILYTALEVLLWVSIILGLYFYLLFFQHHLFVLATSEIPALIAWQICILYLIFRYHNFDRIVKKEFYYGAYMRYIKPEALSAYKIFIEDIDSMEKDKLMELKNEPMPYMHKQALLRKTRELNMK